MPTGAAGDAVYLNSLTNNIYFYGVVTSSNTAAFTTSSNTATFTTSSNTATFILTAGEGVVTTGTFAGTLGYTYNYATSTTSSTGTDQYDWGGNLVTVQDGQLEPWTVEDATCEWLRAERAHSQRWLDAERQYVRYWLDAERKWRNEAAEARAAELLLSLLPEDQQEHYRLNGVFEVIGSHGGRYRVRRGVAGNVDWLDENGRVGGSLCCHPPVGSGDRWLPVADVMLSQMMALRVDEADFVRVANGRKPPHLARAA